MLDIKYQLILFSFSFFCLFVSYLILFSLTNRNYVGYVICILYMGIWVYVSCKYSTIIYSVSNWFNLPTHVSRVYLYNHYYCCCKWVGFGLVWFLCIYIRLVLRKWSSFNFFCYMGILDKSALSWFISAY